MNEQVTTSQGRDIVEEPSKWTEPHYDHDEEEIVKRYNEDIVKRYKRQSPTAVSWYTEGKAPVTPDILLNMRLSYAALMLRDLIDIDAEKASGVPVISGTKFTVSRFIAELADGRSIRNIAKEFSLDKDLLEEILRGLSIYLDRPFVK